MSSKLSARNRLRGKITSIKKGGVVARIDLKLGTGEMVTSIITLDAVDDLNLKVDDEVYAIIKATEVMISKD